MQEFKAVKGLEIGVEGNEAATRGDGKGRQIGVRLEAVGKSGLM